MYEEQVAEGCKWLDEHAPDWWKKIDLLKFNMGQYENCTIGFTLGQSCSEALCGDKAFAVPRGFAICEDPTVEGTWWGIGSKLVPQTEAQRKAEYRVLTSAWIQEILRRRKAAGVPA